MNMSIHICAPRHSLLVENGKESVRSGLTCVVWMLENRSVDNFAGLAVDPAILLHSINAAAKG